MKYLLEIMTLAPSSRQGRLNMTQHKNMSGLMAWKSDQLLPVVCATGTSNNYYLFSRNGLARKLFDYKIAVSAGISNEHKNPFLQLIHH